MASLNHSQEKSARELIDQVVKALAAENGLLRDESNRIRRLTIEAAGSLRRNFRQIDSILHQLNEESVVDRSLEAQRAYREIISILQFEDIVSQVINHQLERSEITLSVLMQIEEHLRADENENFEQTLAKLSAQVDSYLSKLSESESVKQQSLVVGETELF